MKKFHNRSLYLFTLIGLLVFVSSCKTRKYTTRPAEKAAAAADAMSHLKSKNLYRFITDWAGVKYKLGGLDKRGIDCSGFALLLNKEIYGINLPRVSRDQASATRQKNKDRLEEGDLVFFAFGGGTVDHVGVYLNNGFFVHASTTRGVIVDDLNLPVYQNALIKAGSAK